MSADRLCRRKKNNRKNKSRTQCNNILARERERTRNQTWEEYFDLPHVTMSSGIHLPSSGFTSILSFNSPDQYFCLRWSSIENRFSFCWSSFLISMVSDFSIFLKLLIFTIQFIYQRNFVQFHFSSRKYKHFAALCAWSPIKIISAFYVSALWPLMFLWHTSYVILTFLFNAKTLWNKLYVTTAMKRVSCEGKFVIETEVLLFY